MRKANPWPYFKAKIKATEQLLILKLLSQFVCFVMFVSVIVLVLAINAALVLVLETLYH